jgi:hypothetical protein
MTILKPTWANAWAGINAAVLMAIAAAAKKIRFIPVSGRSGVRVTV